MSTPRSSARSRKRFTEFLLRTAHPGGVDGHRHPEDPVPDRLIEVLDVDVALEKQRRDAGDETGVVLADDGDLRVLAAHGRHLRGGADVDVILPCGLRAPKRATFRHGAGGGTTTVVPPKGYCVSSV